MKIPAKGKNGKPGTAGPAPPAYLRDFERIY
jgi:hypothetical protein